MFRNSMGRLHRLLGRSRTIARLARNVRNQANAISSAYCSEVEGANSESNKWRYNEFALIDRIAPQAINFIDVGANVGWWSTHFISRMNSEPVGLIVELDRFIDKPNLALGSEPGEAILHEYELSVLNSLIPNSPYVFRFSPEAKSLPVKVVSLDGYCEAHSIVRMLVS